MQKFLCGLGCGLLVGAFSVGCGSSRPQAPIQTDLPGSARKVGQIDGPTDVWEYKDESGEYRVFVSSRSSMMAVKVR